MDQDVEAGCIAQPPSSQRSGIAGPSSRDCGADSIQEPTSDALSEVPTAGEHRPSSSQDENLVSELPPSKEELLYLKTWLAYTYAVDIPTNNGSTPEWFYPTYYEAQFGLTNVEQYHVNQNINFWLFSEHAIVQQVDADDSRAFPALNSDFANAIISLRDIDRVHLHRGSSSSIIKTSSLLDGQDSDQSAVFKSITETGTHVAQQSLIILVPNLTQVTYHVLLNKFRISSRVLQQHTVSLGTIAKAPGSLSSSDMHESRSCFTPQYFFDLDGQERLISLNFEGDIDGSPKRDSKLAKAGLVTERWPALFTRVTEYAASTDDAFHTRLAESQLRTSSRVSLHAFKDDYGHSRVLVLFDHWGKSILFNAIEEVDHLGYSPPSSFLPPFERHTIADGEPLLHSGRPDEPDCESFCRELAASLSHWRLDENTDLDVLLQASVRHIWPRAAAIISRVACRDWMRLRLFSERHYARSSGEKAQRSRLADEVEALEFFDRRVLQQIDTLETFRRALSTPAFDSHDIAWKTIQNQIEGLQRQLTTLQGRSAFLMSRILRTEQRQLTYSQLDEALLVRKLTLVALFFIPVSAVTSAYGMNLTEINNGKPSWRSFAIALVVVTGVAFVIAAFDAIRDIDAAIIRSLIGSHAHIESYEDMIAPDYIDRDLNTHHPGGPDWMLPLFKFYLKAFRPGIELCVDLAALCTDMRGFLALFIYKWVLTGIPRAIGSYIIPVLHSMKRLQSNGRRQRELKKD